MAQRWSLEYLDTCRPEYLDRVARDNELILHFPAWSGQGAEEIALCLFEAIGLADDHLPECFLPSSVEILALARAVDAEMLPGILPEHECSAYFVAKWSDR